MMMTQMQQLDVLFKVERRLCDRYWPKYKRESVRYDLKSKGMRRQCLRDHMGGLPAVSGNAAAGQCRMTTRNIQPARKSGRCHNKNQSRTNCSSAVCHQRNLRTGNGSRIVIGYGAHYGIWSPNRNIACSAGEADLTKKAESESEMRKSIEDESRLDVKSLILSLVERIRRAISYIHAIASRSFFVAIGTAGTSLLLVCVVGGARIFGSVDVDSSVNKVFQNKIVTINTSMASSAKSVADVAEISASKSTSALKKEDFGSGPPRDIQLLQLIKAELRNAADVILNTQTYDLDEADSKVDMKTENEAGIVKEAEEAEAVINEVWETVDTYYFDARDKGFSREKWRQSRDAAIKAHPQNRQIAYRYIRRMLAKGLSDSYTRFLSPYEYSSFVKYDVTGVGMNLVSGEEYARKSGDDSARDRDGLFVLGLMKNSPAEKAGIVRGDEIISVDGEKCMKGSTPFDIASLIQGDEAQRGKTVTIAANDIKSGKVKEFILTRPAMTKVRSPVTSSIETQGKKKVGYIRLQEMNSLAQREVKNAIEGLESQGASRVILDLRDNPGGLVQVAVAISELFLPDQSVVVSSQGRHPSSQQILKTSKSPISEVPLVVLVNGRTASSSEILAASLQDNCRATLVGDRTFGKGLIQSVFELEDGSGLVITVGKYVTPSGKDIDRLGIFPDFNYMPSIGSASKASSVCSASRTSI